jgi:DNA repair exonuclease SbcCD ATPase subunit
MGDLPERLRETAEASVRTPHEYQISVLDEAADEIERLRAKVEELERELASHRQFLERLTDNGTNYPETFDDLVELGLVVSVPPTPEFIDEWGDDAEMYVLAWKAHEFEEVE